MKRQVTVQIAGQRYTLRSDADEDSVKQLASYVDGRIRDIQRQTRTADTQALATLAALQIAEELFGEREAQAALKKKIRDKGQALLQFLEREARV
ncbi:MAG TPA: cell division protein ZapA [Polyangia bacterium]|nr:cell division protein ZapA [Polyangia bacterium]